MSVLDGFSIYLLDEINKFASEDVQESLMINRELVPILSKMVTPTPGNKQRRAAAKQLYNWLVGPKCGAEEFTYVLGKLAGCVFYEVFHKENIPRDFSEAKGDYSMYLGKVAAEALAVKCPVLEGSWATAAVTVLRLNKSYDKSVYGVASDHLSAWIIHVIGDPDICSDPVLRVELMTLLLRMVDLNDLNRKQALESVLSAFSTLTTDSLNCIATEYRHIELDDITTIFEMFTKDGFLLEFDKKLAEKLMEVQSTRYSAMVYDVGYLCAAKSTRLTEPKELYGIVSLLKNLHAFEDKIYCFSTSIMDMLYVILSNFKSSCQTPQLVRLVALCIIDLVEIVISEYRWDEPEDQIQELKKLDLLLSHFFVEYPNDLSSTPVGLEIERRYEEHRNSIMDIFDDYYEWNDFPMVRAVIEL